MDRIAEELEYSKGTIYLHFSCKEEILLALAGESMETRLQMFRRAADFRGRARERMTAVGVACELIFQLRPDDMKIEHAVRMASIYEKSTENRRRFLESCEQNCMGTLAGIVRDGVVSGDLHLPADFGPSNWYLAFAGSTMGARAFSRPAPR